MAGDKTAHAYELVADQIAFLQDMADEYSLPDPDKALRILIDYVKEEGDRDTIFTQVRCLRCG